MQDLIADENLQGILFDCQARSRRVLLSLKVTITFASAKGRRYLHFAAVKLD